MPQQNGCPGLGGLEILSVKRKFCSWHRVYETRDRATIDRTFYLLTVNFLSQDQLPYWLLYRSSYIKLNHELLYFLSGIAAHINIVGAATLSILITKRYLSRFMLYSYIYIIIQFKFHYLFLIKSHLQSYPCPNKNAGFIILLTSILILLLFGESRRLNFNSNFYNIHFFLIIICFLCLGLDVIGLSWSLQFFVRV